MKKKLSIWLCLLAISMSLTAQNARGKVLESQSIKSEILKKSMLYSIYLPPDYENSERHYPVVYLLHGLWGSNTDWVNNGEANRALDKGIASGDLPDMIVVMPDCGNQWYINSVEGYNYEDYFTKELVPFIDKTYRTRPNRENRALSGLSMGGYGASLYALKHPDMFSACAALSSAILTDESFASSDNKFYETYLEKIYGKALGNDRTKLEYWRKNSVLNLIQNGNEADLKKVKWYFDCGDDDYLYKGNAALLLAMRDRKIPSEFRMREGAHTWEYWRTGLVDALKFIGQSFKH